MEHLDLSSENFSLLGLDFNVNLNPMPEINYKKAMEKLKRSIAFWKKMSLTPIGKITVIKSLLLSKLNHFFMSILLPNKCFIKNIEKLLYGFLWDRKPEKINRGQLTQNHLNGGLNMPNIYKFVTALKITWLRRLIVEQSSDWSILFQITHSSCIKIIDYGPIWMKILSEKTKKCILERNFRTKLSKSK